MAYNSKHAVTINSYRPIPFYFINTREPAALSEGAIFQTMEQLKKDGFGGIVLFNKPPDGFSEKEYLEGQWFEITGYFAEAGKQLGLQIWVNDGFDFPPGDAGGRIQ